MNRFDCEFKEVLGAAIPLISHDRQVVIESNLSPHEGVNLLRDLKCFLRSCHRVVLSLRAQLFRGFVITAVMRGSGSSVGVGREDMQVRRIIIFALGHCVLLLQGNFPPDVSASLPQAI
jgi:hypothetical protein